MLLCSEQPLQQCWGWGGKACEDGTLVCPRRQAPGLGSHSSLRRAAAKDSPLSCWAPMAGRRSRSPAHEHVTTSLAWQDFPEVIWSMPLLRGHSLLLVHQQVLLLVRSPGCPEPALAMFPLIPSVPLEILADAYHSGNSESGAPAAASNAADVSSTHPPKLPGHQAHVK